MTIPLSEPVTAYFEGNAQLDVDSMLAPFAPDAVVFDEKRTHRGHDLIRAWIEDATIANAAIATPLSLETDGGRQRVAVEVKGKFPGSPVSLTFHFTIEDKQIKSLEIG